MIYSGSLVVGQRAFATVTRHVEVCFGFGFPTAVEVRLFDPRGTERGKLSLRPDTWRPLLAAIREHRRGGRGELVSAPISGSLEVAVVSVDARELALAVRTINGHTPRGRPHRFAGGEIGQLEEALVLAIGASA